MTEDALGDLKRFRREMKHLGITVEWRVAPKKDIDWHDRFIVGRNQAWNVPPVNTLQTGDYSELEKWWAEGTPLADWLNQQQRAGSWAPTIRRAVPAFVDFECGHKALVLACEMALNSSTEHSRA